MKKIAVWNNYIEFSQNKLFNEKTYTIGEDLGYSIILLKKELEKLGYIVETLDMDDSNNYDKVIFIDYPNPFTCCCNINLIPKEKKYLILTECSMIYELNSRPDLYCNFAKVFTYDDNLIHKYGYIKLNMPNKMKTPVQLPFEQKKDITLIAGNKVSNMDGELYSERLNIINYLEKIHPDIFEFYGKGWEKHIFTGGKIVRAFNRFHMLQRIIAKRHLCFKGSIQSKIGVLSKYKFCICYENSRLIPGYISEKIWDCFFSGCVPVYLGAPNIHDYIPGNVFIDRREFDSNEQLIDFLTAMNKDDYNKYLINAKMFIASIESYPYSSECYVKTIIGELF